MKKTIITIASVLLILASCKKAPINNVTNNIVSGNTKTYIINDIEISQAATAVNLILPAHVLDNFNKEQITLEIQPADGNPMVGPNTSAAYWATLPYKDSNVNIQDFGFAPFFQGLFISSSIAAPGEYYNFKVTITQ